MGSAVYVIVFIIVLLLIIGVAAFFFNNNGNCCKPVDDCKRPVAVLVSPSSECGSSWGIGIIFLIFLIVLIGLFCWRGRGNGLDTVDEF